MIVGICIKLKQVRARLHKELMKMLGRIAKAIGGVTENLFEDFRLEHSRILNQKKLKGTLCLSIHPMDYITISDNANNWSSCMSWMEDGDYRMGTVEMLNSPNVVVAYLKSDKHEFTWGSNSWNSKMWRTLLIVDPKLLISVKSYPFENADLTKEALEWVRQLANDNVDWSFPYPCEELHESSDNEWRGDFYHIVCNCGAMYNDFGAMTHYGSIATDAPSRIDIWYSGPSECMWCGQLDPDIYEKSYVFGSCCCEDEGSNYYCDECGCRINEDYTYWVEDIAVCESCYERLTAWDDFQDEAIFKDNAVEVYLCRENDKPMEEQDYSLTIHERYLESYHYQPHNYYSKFFTCSPHYNEESHLWYWNVVDVTAEGLWTFFGVKDPDAYIADK
jgi:hypothetical protein